MSRLFPLIFVAFPLIASDVTGAWEIVGSAMGFPVNALCAISQQNKKLSGNCVSKRTRIDAKVSGEMDGPKIVFRYDFMFEGTPMTVAYDGKLENDGMIRGDMEVLSDPPAPPSSAKGTFIAYKGKRVAAPAKTPPR